MSGVKGVAAVTSLIPVTNTQLNTVRVLLSVFAATDKSDKSSRAINTAAIHKGTQILHVFLIYKLT